MGIMLQIQRWIEQYWFAQQYKKTVGRSSIEDEMPWITFRSVNFLERLLRLDMQVFEFGMGGSTMFFARRVGKVFSVDHDALWYAQAQTHLQKKNLQNVENCLIEGIPIQDYPQKHPENPQDYVSYYVPKWHHFSFEAYARSIEKYPDHFFDIVFIDGRVRNSCAMHAISKVKKGGYLVLDNAEREGYAYIHNTMRHLKWKPTHFWGIGGYNYPHNNFWQTSFWQSP